MSKRVGLCQAEQAKDKRERSTKPKEKVGREEKGPRAEHQRERDRETEGRIKSRSKECAPLRNKRPAGIKVTVQVKTNMR